MLTDHQIDEAPEGTFKRIAEAAWALQANHERFLFKKARARNHPSRVPWVNANNLWQAQTRANRQRAVV